MTRYRVIIADCVEAMPAMPAASVDAVVTDPPYGLSFMGKAWDTFDPVTMEQRVGRRDSNGPLSDSRDGRNKGRTKSAFANSGGEADTYDFSARGNRGFQRWCEAWAAEVLRVLKPGGHLLAFGGTRTYHRLAAGIEDAGFEVRDTIAWMYGSGFPKSLDVAKAIDKAAGAERVVIGQRSDGVGNTEMSLHKIEGFAASREPVFDLTAPATPDAEDWQGWGTALKPAFEPIVVARKPLAGTVRANVLAHGTGALNIDGCRIEAHDDQLAEKYASVRGTGPRRNGVYGEDKRDRDDAGALAPHANGRWPANVILDPDAATMLDEQTGQLHPPGNRATTRASSNGATTIFQPDWDPARQYADRGGASRFFYVAKASSDERNAGLDAFEAKGTTADSYGSIQTPKPDRAAPRENWTPHPVRNTHPTVKPIALMRWLVRLVTPPGGTVLDPFTGSGTTGCAAVLEGFQFIGIEREAEYAEIARARIAWWADHPDGMKLVHRLEAEAERKARADAGQLALRGMEDVA